MYIGHVLEKRPIAMKDFDTLAVAKVARRQLESIREPRRRLILENFIEHAEAEGRGDYDALMASCSRKQQVYATHGSDFPAPQSYEELERHYFGLIAMNLFVIHFEVEKLVFVEGIVHQLYPGHLVEPFFGVKVEDPARVQQLTKRTALSFVFDADGKGAGEHAFSDGPTVAADFTPVADDEVPAIFHAHPLAGRTAPGA
jgi:hypothetical protein